MTTGIFVPMGTMAALAATVILPILYADAVNYLSAYENGRMAEVNFSDLESGPDIGASQHALRCIFPPVSGALRKLQDRFKTFRISRRTETIDADIWIIADINEAEKKIDLRKFVDRAGIRFGLTRIPCGKSLKMTIIGVGKDRRAEFNEIGSSL